MKKLHPPIFMEMKLHLFTWTGRAVTLFVQGNTWIGTQLICYVLFLMLCFYRSSISLSPVCFDIMSLYWSEMIPFQSWGHDVVLIIIGFALKNVYQAVTEIFIKSWPHLCLSKWMKGGNEWRVKKKVLNNLYYKQDSKNSVLSLEYWRFVSIWERTSESQ